MERIRKNIEPNAIPSHIYIINTSDADNQSSIIQETSPESQTPINLIEVVQSHTSIESDNLSDTLLSNSPLIGATKNDSAYIPVEVEAMTILSSMFESEEFETGISNPSERYFCQLMDSNAMAALNSLLTLFMDNYSVDGRKANILIGILHILSHLDYQKIYPHGQVAAISAIGHKNKSVAEYGIKCFENWGHPDGIEKLSSVHFTTSWLQEYAQDVIDELTNG